ncbi:MAG: glycosyltransferase [Xanthomonadales bacterium]|nr:glycosyltransferase [Xanthomonadales bacterium]
MPKTAVIVSTYMQPGLLDRCLQALARQSLPDFELLIADDGSDQRTAQVIERHRAGFKQPVQHIWQADEGFRKTRILNRAVLATRAAYLVFIDGDCVVHPDFLSEHMAAAQPGVFLNGSLIRLSGALSDRVTPAAIASGEVFRAGWLLRNGGGLNRRFLRLSLPYRLRCWLNRHSPTELYWLGSNSSCHRSDLLAVNGFDNRFTYGFEDGDFGNRLQNYGVAVHTVRWTAVALHLWHGRPWSSAEIMERNRALMAPLAAGGHYRAIDGLAELQQARGDQQSDQRAVTKQLG